MPREQLFRVFFDFYVVAKDSEEAGECVELMDKNTMTFTTTNILNVDGTEEAISFLQQLMASRVDDDQIESVMISYLKAKGVTNQAYLYYKDCVDALRRAIKERSGEESTDEED